jgi:hypothetical protein
VPMRLWRGMEEKMKELEHLNKIMRSIISGRPTGVSGNVVFEYKSSDGTRIRLERDIPKQEYEPKSPPDEYLKYKVP